MSTSAFADLLLGDAASAPASPPAPGAGFAPLAFPVLREAVPTETVERARVQGHAAGYAAGRHEAAALLDAERVALAAEHEQVLAGARADAQRMQEALAAAVRQVEQRATAALETTDATLLAAAVELAAAIVGRELADGPASAAGALARALAAAGTRVVQAVHLHPADLALLGARAEGEVPLVADASLDRGDAVARLTDGLVDARVATAIERMRAAVAGVDQ